MKTKQYNCQTCGATFEDEIALREHNRTEHAMHECDVCAHVFVTEEDLNAHRRKMHPHQEEAPGY